MFILYIAFQMIQDFEYTVLGFYQYQTVYGTQETLVTLQSLARLTGQLVSEVISHLFKCCFIVEIFNTSGNKPMCKL